MFVNFKIPERVSIAVAGLKPYQRARVLKMVEDKIRLLFHTNFQNLYQNEHNYASWYHFLNSFSVVNNDGKDFTYFYDEEELKGENKNFEFEDNLFSGEIEIKPAVQDDYIEKSDKLQININNDLEEYLSDDFWKEFDKEGR